jgi:glycosyltransferase involved in cell wall biosynthesis
MKIAILGTRGIPNNYGGFEQFAQYLSKGLAETGHEVYVYNPHNHIYRDATWQGVHIIHQYDPEYAVGTFGQFIYDFNCIMDSRGRQFDIILQLGYTSSSIWGRLLPKNTVIITNMDGLEWKRTKYSAPVQKLLKMAEKWAIETSDYIIADSLGIQRYLQNKYRLHSTFIPYGAFIFDNPDPSALLAYDLQPHTYDMLIARLEPENSIDIILQGVVQSKKQRPFLVIGNWHSAYGKYLKSKYANTCIRFLGSVYTMSILNNLRYYSNIYFHGHTVGGTNPSLLEAMASSALICAHQNEFNSTILGKEAYYFTDSTSVAHIMSQVNKRDKGEAEKISQNLSKIEYTYSWNKIIGEYESLLQHCYYKMNASQPKYEKKAL